MKEYDFSGEDMVDDLQYKIHPRLFLRLPVLCPLELYKASSAVGKTKRWDTKLPTNNYSFSHANLSGVFMPRGLGQLFDQANPTFDLTLLTARNGLLASSTKYQMSRSAEFPTFEPCVNFEPISSLQQFRVTFSALEMWKRRIDPLDFSLEPLRAFLDWHDYFEGPSHVKTRLHLDPGVFCTQLVNQVVSDNAQRWHSGEGFFTYHHIVGKFNLYVGQMERTPELFQKKHMDVSASAPSDTPSSSSQRTPQKPKKPSKFCHAYNSEKGCESKAYPFCYVNKEKKIHKCNVKMAKGNYCTEFHTRFEHDEEIKKKS